MAADPVTTALQALPDGADHLTTALAGAGAGARVLPVLRCGNTYVPIDVPMGPGRSRWTAATRDHGRLRRFFAEHPDAVPAFVDQTEARPRARIWSGRRLATIPNSYVRA